jgi:hypothetical protein
MSPNAALVLAYALAFAGLACFLWPTIRRLRGDETAAGGLRSRSWLLGLVLTVLALMMQRMAAGG